MHIPDGYLGPPTYLACFGITSVLMTTAFRQLKGNIESKKIPLISMAGAFSFLVMMFNVPIPGGTTGHIIGSVLIALVVNPWAAFIAISMALLLQALLFGDGGITALGANCLNIALIAPFVGYYSFHFLQKWAHSRKAKSIIAGISGWLGLNAAALFTSILLGIQPLLHRGADGHALYAPYPLSVAIPAIMIGHLFVFGVIEGIVTGLTVYFLKLTEESGGLVS